jgi:hypothetical protein
MNHLRELLELHPSQWLVPASMDDDSAYHVANELHAAAESAMCFDIGDVDDYDGIRIVKELCVLPFDTCWFEIDCHDGDKQWVVCALVYKGDFGVRIIGFRKKLGQWSLLFFAGFDEFLAPLGFVIPESEKGCLQQAAVVRSKLAVFLTAMSCKNVQRACVTPSEKLQKARKKRGKKPLFSYWVLELNGKKDPSAPLGGTHASPRLHLRRGHPREYAPGKWTWVTESIVGNKAMGMIHKDYSAGKSLTDNARKVLQAA